MLDCSSNLCHVFNQAPPSDAPLTVSQKAAQTVVLNNKNGLDKPPARQQFKCPFLPLFPLYRHRMPRQVLLWLSAHPL